MNAKSKLTANDISALLKKKHQDDVFVPECNTGQTGNHLRMDAWVMPRSWAKPWLTSYEIKVSRSDYVRDDKWIGYLPMCNLFYFVCPYGLISTEETPSDAGLMWVSKTGTKIYTKKKAPLRTIDAPEDVFRYVLMARTIVSRERHQGSRGDYWKQWLIDRKAGKKVGREIRHRLSQEKARHVEEVERENIRLKRENNRLAQIKNFCEEAEINIFSHNTKHQIEALQNLIPDGTIDAINRMQSALNELRKALHE